MTAVVTGKPVNLGGSRGRREATGRGVLMVCDQAIKNSLPESRLDPSCRAGLWQRRFERGAAYGRSGIQGYRHCRSGGGLYKKEGIDLVALSEFRQRNGTIHGFPGAEAHDPDQLLLVDCDILIPAATGNVITARMPTA